MFVPEIPCPCTCPHPYGVENGLNPFPGAAGPALHARTRKAGADNGIP